MNRFIINLRSLSTAGSSQDSSSRQYSSRLSTLNFHIPDSFLGNIGEDLQDGHVPTDNDLNGQYKTDAASLNAEGSLETELEETSTTSGSSTSRTMNAQVSLQVHSRLMQDGSTPIHLG